MWMVNAFLDRDICAAVGNVWVVQPKLKECLTSYGQAMERLNVISLHFRQRAMRHYDFDFESDSSNSMVHSMGMNVIDCMSPAFVTHG